MYDIIYNPASGKSKNAFKQVTKILDTKKIDYKTHITESSGHAMEITRELNKQPQTKLIILGGDGTFNEVLNGIDNFETITLGLIPCGTGNDFIKAAKIPFKTAEALDVILKDNAQFTDFIQLNGKRCLNIAGAGMDVDVLERYSTMKFWKGKIKYYMSLFDILIHLRFHDVEITIDGKTMQKKVFLISVANGTCIGGGMPISPNSVVNDGILDIVFVNEIKGSKVLPLLLKFLRGKHIDEPCTEVFHTTEASIKVLDEGKIQVDGEIIAEKTLDCKVATNKLKIYA